MNTCVLAAALLGVFAMQPAARLSAQEGGLFTAPPAAADAARAQAPARKALAEIRSRAVGVDLSRLPSPIDADRPNRLVLNLFDDVQLEAVVDRIENPGAATKTYIGHVEGLADHVAGVGDNAVTLVVSDGVMVGSINTPRATYQVRFDGSRHIIRQVDPTAFPDEFEPTPTANLPPVADNAAFGADARRADEGPAGALPPIPAGAAARDAAADDGSRVDVMVLYTSTARAAAGGTAAIQNLITLGVTETNQIYANSGIGTRMRLVHMREVAYGESGNAQTDRDRLFNGADGHLDFVHTLRNTYGADMVQMLVNNAGSGCGIAFLNGPVTMMAAQSAYAYAVTDWQCVSPNYTFAHEFGHIQGSNHAPDDPTGTGAYAFSFGFKRCNTTPYFRSVMAYGCPAGSAGPGTARSMYFSNPNVFFNGAPTGTATQNNALSMHLTRGIIANFRAEQPLVEITQLWLPASRPFGGTTTLWARVQNNGPYPLPASARVWFYTDGPGAGSGEGWVGSTALTGLAPGANAWYAFNWTIPITAIPGAWNYWARVYDGAAGEYLSNWRGPQAFTVLNLAAQVTSVWPVPVAQAGKVATLWAKVRNTGNAPFPAGVTVYFSVSGPGGLNTYVGSTPMTGLAVGAEAWYSFNWTIPITRPGGLHSYRAIVWYQAAGAWRTLSVWSATQNFNVTPAPAFGGEVPQLWPVSTVAGGAPERGETVRLWARVLNTGVNVHNANTFVYFYVTGPGFANYVGSATTAGLASGGTTWKFFDWTIPATASLGAYSYRASVWQWTGTSWVLIGPWSGTQNFGVASDSRPVQAGDAPVAKTVK